MSNAILSFGLTPGDVEMGCGGAVARLAEQGLTPVNIFFSYFGENTAELEEESARAARAMGVSEVTFLHLPMCPAVFSREAAVSAAELIRTYRPVMLFTVAPTDASPDLQGLSCLVTAAADLAADPASEDVSGMPWKAPAVYGFELKPPLSTYHKAVNIDLSIESKLEAIRAYDYLARKNYDRAMKGLSLYRGAMTGQGKHAEVFQLLAGSLDADRFWA